MERLQNILSHAGVASRRHAAEIIAEGRVTVDGLVVREAGARVDPKAKIAVDGKLLAAETHRTIMLYKPVGVLSSMSDPFGGRTVADVLRGQVPERLVPVGRLDKDSEGLLLMSNDGDLVLRLTHPRYEHEKTYVVRAAGRWNEEKLRILRGPVKMPDGYETRPVPVRVIKGPREGQEKVEMRGGETEWRSGLQAASAERKRNFPSFTQKRSGDRFSTSTPHPSPLNPHPSPLNPLPSTHNNITTLEFKLREGRKRQIRYMCSAAHLVVLSLKRVAVGGVALDPSLQPGQWRDLTDAELQSLA